MKTCNFNTLEVTAMYFTFLETSNLFSIWTREVKTVAVCSVYDMLSGIPIGLLHEIAKGLTVFWITVPLSTSVMKSGGA